MKVNRINSTNFRTSVSPDLKAMLEEQAIKRYGSPSLKAEINEQIDNIWNWGSPFSQIFARKDATNHYQLALRQKLNETTYKTKIIEQLTKRSFISKFLQIKEEHILRTEREIKQELKTKERYA